MNTKYNLFSLIIFSFFQLNSIDVFFDNQTKNTIIKARFNHYDNGSLLETKEVIIQPRSHEYVHADQGTFRSFEFSPISGYPNFQVWGGHHERYTHNGMRFDANDATGAIYVSNPTRLRPDLVGNWKLYFKDNDTTLLHEAVLNKNNIHRVKTLVDNGEDVNKKNDNGTTPLMHAAIVKDNQEIIQFLIDRGAKKDLKDKFGNTAYSLAIKNAYNENAQLLK